MKFLYRVIDIAMGVARIFQSGGQTESYIGYSPDCVLQNGLQRGAHGLPRTPPGYVFVSVVVFKMKA